MLIRLMEDLLWNGKFKIIYLNDRLDKRGTWMGVSFAFNNIFSFLKFCQLHYKCKVIVYNIMDFFASAILFVWKSM